MTSLDRLWYPLTVYGTGPDAAGHCSRKCCLPICADGCALTPALAAN